MTAAPRRPSVLALTFWPHESGLIQAYTLPYLRLIARHIAPQGGVVLVTLEPEGSPAVPPSSDGIRHFPLRYRRFGLAAIAGMALQLLRLRRLCRDEDIRVIHAFCTPAGAIGWALSLLTGLPLVIDSYEPHAESMVENGTWSRWGAAYLLLHLFEVLQTRRACAVIAASPAMRDYARRRYGVEFAVFHSKPACVDLDRFSPRPKDPALLAELGLNGKVVGVYAGKLGGIYLDAEVFAFFKAAKDHWGERFKALLLTPHTPRELEGRASSAGLAADDLVIRSVPYERMPDYLALADFALTPVKPVPTKRYCTPIKDGEYWAMGLPVVITRDISDDSDIIAANAAGAVIKTLDRRGYEAAADAVARLLEARPRRELSVAIRDLALRHRSYSLAEEVYASLYEPRRNGPLNAVFRSPAH